MAESAGAKSQNSQVLVVNLRGIVNTRTPVRATLAQLGILKRFSATMVPDSPELRGMLNLAKNNVAWCAADAESSKLFEKSGKRSTVHLNSPRGGFKRSIRRQFGQGGILGPNPQLNELVSSMRVQK
jgi:large subunit ribosomal protein L30